MKCPNCQHENRLSAKFCDECGTQLPRSCPQCGAEVRPTAKFCDACGAELATSTAPAVALPRLEELQDRLYIPKPLSDRMQAAEQELAGENRLV